MENNYILNYPGCSIYETIKKTSENFSQSIALKFFNKKISYKELIEKIDNFASGLITLGFKKNDVIAVALPNIPESVIAFYAINKIGCVCVMIHPLSSTMEFEHYLKESKAKGIITLDLIYPRHNIFDNLKVIITKTSASLSFPYNKAVDFSLRKKKIPLPEKNYFIFSNLYKKANTPIQKASNDLCSILFSGGTSTGLPKGIMLSNFNFNALACQILSRYKEELKNGGLSILAILPMFHGFGLGICIHSMMAGGCCSILVPTFSKKVFASSIKKYKPSFIAGVPTLYEALLRNKSMKNVDLSCLVGAFCGGDKLPKDIKVRFDDFLKNHGSKLTLLEGYGLTETVTACTLMPSDVNLYDSAGIPLEDIEIKIVKENTTENIGRNQDGEICIKGPTVMIGYLNSEDDNKKAFQKHDDGQIWLHTGDMGYVDDNGFLFFKQRIKRILKVSGIPVYPSLIEEVIRKLDFVEDCCIIGTSHDYQMERPMALIKLSFDIEKEKAKEEILKLCREKLSKWSVPYKIEFIKEIPVTKMGKIDYISLEKKYKN